MRKFIFYLTVFSFLISYSNASAWSLFAQETSAWETIVIDPGHGGGDDGTKGANSSEKNIALEISNKLSAAITKRLGLRVVLTRPNDESIPLINRTAIANNNKADIFLSIHCDSSQNSNLQGISLYVFSGEVKQNPASGLILWDNVQNGHRERSMALAGAIHNYVTSQGIISRGVFSAPITNLIGADMPAVLIEMGYLSNSEEEEKLRNPDYQALLANSILEGILVFKNYE